MGNGYVDKRLGMYRDAGGADGIIPGDLLTWEEFVTVMGDDLRQWITDNFPFGDIITWNDFIEKFGDQLNTWLTENYPAIIEGDTINWNDFITSLGDDLRQWITEVFPYIQNPTWNEFIELYGDEFNQWITENYPTIVEGNPINWEEFITAFGDDLRTWLTENYPITDNPLTWDEFITNFGDDLQQWFETNYPNAPGTTWNEFITAFGDDLRQWLTENYPYIENPITWNEFITNFGDDLTTWLTENYPTFEGATFEEFITALGDDLRTWLTENYPYIDNTFEDWRKFIEQIVKNYTGEDLSTRLISGSVRWIENLDFKTTLLHYQILGIEQKALPTTVTIPANDQANPRYAIIYADLAGNVGYILGDAAAAPLKPIVNPSNQIEITLIYIPALGTEPGEDPNGEGGNATNTVIYNENTEWTTAKTEDAAVTTVDFDAVTNPANGTKHISILTAVAAAGWILQDTIIQDTNTFKGYFTQTLGEGTTNFQYVFGNMLSDDSVDFVRDGVRHVIYYRVNPETPQTFTALNRTNGQKYKAFISEVITFSDWWPAKTAELGIDPEYPSLIRISFAEAVPAGDYKFTLDDGEGLIRTELLYVAGDSVTNTTGAAEISFTAPAAVNAAGGNLLFSLLTDTAWLATSGYLIELYNGGTRVGLLTFAAGNYYGFNPLLLDTYQQVSIPIANFNLVGENIDKIIFRPVNSWAGSTTLYLDYIYLQTGIEVPAEDEPLKIGDWVEDQAFEFRDVSADGDEYILDIAASYNYKILEAVIKTDTGTLTANISIDGSTALTCAADNTIKTFAPAAEAKVKPEELVKITIADLAGAAAISGKIRTVRF